MGALMRRKGGIWVVALLVVMLMVVGCGRQDRAPQAAPVVAGYGLQEPPVTIDFWYMPNGPSPDKVVRREVDRFHALHPNITVRATKLDWPDALTRLTTAAASGSGPDVSQLGTTWVGSISSLGGLRPFSDDELAWLGGREAYLPASWTSTRLLGRTEVTAVPWFVDIRAVFYRTDILRSLDIDPATAFTDWRSFAATLDRISAGGKVAALGQPGKADWNVVHNVAPFVWEAGGDFLSADGTRATVATPAALDGVDYYRKLVAKYNSRFVLRGTYTEARRAFVDGRVAVLTDAPESVATYRGTAKLGGRWATAPMPTGPKGRFTFLGGSNLSLWKASQHPAVALEWIRFLTGEESQRRYVSGIGLWPARLSATTKAPFGSDPAYRAFTAQIPNGRQYPAVAAWNGIEVALHKAFGTMWDRVLATGSPLTRRELEALLNRATTDVQQAIAETG
jgi:multiple sugar transport system substrate-binding protein